MTKHWFLLILATFVLLPAQAAIVYTSPVDFAAATSSLDTNTLDFEGATLGTVIPSGSGLGGITFVYDIFGLDLAVVNDFNTTSGTQYLGLNDPDNSNVFLAGDVFSMSFAPSRAIGMYFITSGGTPESGSIQLITPLGIASSAATPWTVLGDGAAVYFLGVVADPSDASFSTASIDFVETSKGQFQFNVDDITLGSPIPEPSLGLLVVAGLCAIGLGKARASRC